MFKQFIVLHALASARIQFVGRGSGRSAGQVNNTGGAPDCVPVKVSILWVSRSSN